jgi:serine/threonine-protein kinase RsbW
MEPDAGGSAVRVTELAVLRARCGRQALAIDKLREAVSVLRAGACALKAENAELRSENERICGVRDTTSELGRHAVGPGHAEAHLAVDVWAPAAARALVADCLCGRVSALTIERAQLVISELVGNSLRHASGPPDRALVVRISVEDALCRLEVEDAGCDGEVAPRVPDVKAGGGLGLNIVHTLSERWGIERAAGSGTRVWAYLADAPPARERAPLKLVRAAADV